MQKSIIMLAVVGVLAINISFAAEDTNRNANGITQALALLSKDQREKLQDHAQKTGYVTIIQNSNNSIIADQKAIADAALSSHFDQNQMSELFSNLNKDTLQIKIANADLVNYVYNHIATDQQKKQIYTILYKSAGQTKAALVPNN